MEKIRIIAYDGYELSALYASASGLFKGNIILSSATGIKKEFYISFSNYLVKKGYNVLLYDYRGIGGSAPKNLKAAGPFMHEWGTKDMNAALDYMVNEKGLKDIIWLGHSVGAQLVGFLDNRQQVSKIIAVNAAFGYWKYFPFPMKWVVWCLWYFVAPLSVKVYGYGVMQKFGWGENLSRNMMKQWRQWCLSKTYFTGCLQQLLNTDKFYGFNTPITAVYISDDFIANDKTVPMMMQFFPDSPQKILKLFVKEYTTDEVGHSGIFRKKFEKNLWPVLAGVIER